MTSEIHFAPSESLRNAPCAFDDESTPRVYESYRVTGVVSTLEYAWYMSYTIVPGEGLASATVATS